MNPAPSRLCLGLTIRGAVALGAFEAGALAALLVGVQRLNETRNDSSPSIDVDAISAASAGAINAVLVARILLAGLDPIGTLYSCWVKRDSLNALRRGASSSPLSTDELSRVADILLKAPPKSSEADLLQMKQRQQTSPIATRLMLTNMRGLSCDFRVEGTPLGATSFMDWADFTYARRYSGTPVDPMTLDPSWEPGVQAALASGANPFAFLPKYLDRRKDIDQFAAVANMPSSHGFWYSDGGAIDNEPFGETMRMAFAVDGLNQVDRLHLLIHPTADSVCLASEWAVPEIVPSWSKSGLHVLQVIRSQSIYNDLQHLAVTNDRVRDTSDMADLIAFMQGHLPDSERQTFDQAWNAMVEGIRERKRRSRTINWQRAWEAWLHDLVPTPPAGLPAFIAIWTAYVAADPLALPPGPLLTQALDLAIEMPDGLAEAWRRAWNDWFQGESANDIVPPPTRYTEDGASSADLWDALMLATGLEAKKTARVEAISSSDSELAGEFLESFGGFVDERFRRHDFAVGYRHMLCWMKDRLPQYLAQARADEAYSAAMDRAFTWPGGKQQASKWPTDPCEKAVEDPFSSVGLGSLTWRQRRALFGVGLRIPDLALRDLGATAVFVPLVLLVASVATAVMLVWRGLRTLGGLVLQGRSA